MLDVLVFHDTAVRVAVHAAVPCECELPGAAVQQAGAAGAVGGHGGFEGLHADTVLVLEPFGRQEKLKSELKDLTSV